MDNPYKPPTSQVNRKSGRSTTTMVSLWSIGAACVGGSFVSIWCGMLACWIRSGWLTTQLQRPMNAWGLPIYFWFTTGCVLASAVAVGVLIAPIAVCAMDRLRPNRTFCFVFGICTLVTVGYEILKAKQMIELPTHCLIVVVLAYAIMTPMVFVRIYASLREHASIG